MAVNQVYVGADAGTYARKKARYGHKDWIAWRGKDGHYRAARCTAWYKNERAFPGLWP